MQSITRRGLVSSLVTMIAGAALVPIAPIQAAVPEAKTDYEALSVEYRKGFMAGEQEGWPKGYLAGYDQGRERGLSVNVEAAIIAGAMFDFMGYLTSREERMVLSRYDEPHDLLDAFTEWAKLRGLDIKHADVAGWFKRVADNWIEVSGLSGAVVGRTAHHPLVFRDGYYKILVNPRYKWEDLPSYAEDRE